MEVAFAGELCPAVPWANIEAVVTAKQVVADGAAELERDGAFVLDSEVADTLAGVELVGGGDGLSRADIDAPGAGAAAVFLRLIRFKIEGGENGAQKKPLAFFGVQQNGVFALPSETGLLGDGFFEEWAGVNVGAVFPAPFAENGAEVFKAFVDELVVIAAEGVFGDAAAALGLGLQVIHADHDKGFGLWHEFFGISAAFRVLRHPLHFAVHTALNPAKIELLAQFEWDFDKAHLGKAEIMGFVDDGWFVFSMHLRRAAFQRGAGFPMHFLGRWVQSHLAATQIPVQTLIFYPGIKTKIKNPDQEC